MTGAVFLGMAVAIGVASSALAWAHVRHVVAVLRVDANALAVSLKRTPSDERLRALLDRTDPGTFEHQLAAEALAAPHEDARVAAINDALSEIDHALASRSRWPSTALRIALFGAGLSTFLAYIAEPSVLRWPLSILVVGGVAALTCAQAGRTGERLVAGQRRAIDALVSAVFSLPPAAASRPDPAPDPARRKRRTGRRP